MQISEQHKQLLINEELIARQREHQLLIVRDEFINKLIENYCDVVQDGAISREEWQDFCFQRFYRRDCHTNIPFSTYLNQLMPSLGFPLGYIHTKVRVYRGLKWKAER